MEQTPLWPTETQKSAFQSPIVSGAEMRRSRTGVATSHNNRQTQYSSNRTMHTQQMVQNRQTTNNYRTANNRGMMRSETNRPDYDHTDCTGILPESAPLANPYVPFQRSNPNRYPTQRALARGTLFPGLDLPLCGMINADKPMTPLTELMALQFAVTELGMYLDTHCDDTEVLALFRDYAEKAKVAKKNYEANYGPLTLHAAGTEGKWDWICDPWPWDLCQEG